MDFPRVEMRAGRVLYRAAKRGNGAWWFCHCGECRFDLPTPRGTCYVGTDPMSGFLESFGPDWCAGEPAIVLIPRFVKERVVHEYELPRTVGTANLSSRGAVAFRVTNELSNMTPYDVPQKYAQVFDQTPGRRRTHQFLGIRFRTRFDTGPVTHGLALFGEEGERAWPSSVHDIDVELIAELKAVGVFVEGPPGLAKPDAA
ncbi:RES domain-containing protein [Actinacidiphila oryziradicis]|uniref:RES domain-containing protein n=1 Tax=Actinacidiphila oryziradicis TaxID=2571141 RepID=A0A4U0RG31_9ACTN|nr:RES domain-containing protein [Actinacidiphila oryziradicis]TJZ94449.1 RES domain-containing protein [Actinacidiphila oryziradicis]